MGMGFAHRGASALHAALQFRRSLDRRSERNEKSRRRLHRRRARAWPSMDLDAKRALMQVKLTAGAALFSDLWNAPVKRVAVENPVMHKHAKARIENYQEFTQSIQPWQFGDWERKRTCLWLRGLPALRGLYATEEEAGRALGVSRPARQPRAFNEPRRGSQQRTLAILPIDRTRHGRTMGRLRTRNGKDRSMNRKSIWQTRGGSHQVASAAAGLSR
jgi:hypothetical protein